MSKFKRRDFLKSGSLLTGSLILGNAISAFSNENQTSLTDKNLAIFDVFKNRRSVRKYKSTPIPDEHIKMIIDAARMAPTSGNQQPWKFVVTTDPATIKKLKDTCIENSVARFKSRGNPSESDISEIKARSTKYYEQCFSAPLYITILTDNNSKYPSYNHWDGPLATANLMIAARALGYGTVHYVDSVNSEINKKVLNIPDNYERVCFTPIGVPDEWPETPMKKDLETFIINNSF